MKRVENTNTPNAEHEEAHRLIADAEKRRMWVIEQIVGLVSEWKVESLNGLYNTLVAYDLVESVIAAGSDY